MTASCNIYYQVTQAMIQKLKTSQGMFVTTSKGCRCSQYQQF